VIMLSVCAHNEDFYSMKFDIKIFCHIMIYNITQILIINYVNNTGPCQADKYTSV